MLASADKSIHLVQVNFLEQLDKSNILDKMIECTIIKNIFIFLIKNLY
jgi:hypothetical protein